MRQRASKCWGGHGKHVGRIYVKPFGCRRYENKLGLALVRKQLLEEPPYRFKPEKEPESGYKHDLRQAGPVTRRHSDRVADSGRGMMDAILGLDLLGRRAAEGSVERLAG